MTAMQLYAAYAAPVVLVLMGFAIRAWSLRRIAHAIHGKAGKVEA